MHMEDLKDGRAFAEVAQRVSKKKPVVVLKAGRTPAGARRPPRTPAALAGDDKVYDDILRQAGVIRARRCTSCSSSPAACRCCPRPRARTS